MDTDLGTVEGFLHVMSLFQIMTQRLCTHTLNESTSHIPVVCLNIDKHSIMKMMYLNETLEFQAKSTIL